MHTGKERKNGGLCIVFLSHKPTTKAKSVGLTFDVLVSEMKSIIAGQLIRRDYMSPCEMHKGAKMAETKRVLRGRAS